MQDKDFDELVEQARHADLVDYFRTSGYTLKKLVVRYTLMRSKDFQ